LARIERRPSGDPAAHPREAPHRENAELAVGVLGFSHAVPILQPVRAIDTALLR
jgi:hypothetical protein